MYSSNQLSYIILCPYYVIEFSTWYKIMTNNNNLLCHNLFMHIICMQNNSAYWLYDTTHMKKIRELFVLFLLWRYSGGS